MNGPTPTTSRAAEGLVLLCPEYTMYDWSALVTADPSPSTTRPAASSGRPTAVASSTSTGGSGGSTPAQHGDTLECDHDEPAALRDRGSAG